jgi:hypothetical protein
MQVQLTLAHTLGQHRVTVIIPGEVEDVMGSTYFCPLCGVRTGIVALKALDGTVEVRVEAAPGGTVINSPITIIRSTTTP